MVVAMCIAISKDDYSIRMLREELENFVLQFNQCKHLTS